MTLEERVNELEARIRELENKPPIDLDGLIDELALKSNLRDKILYETTKVTDSSNRPDHREGRLIYETDTDKIYVSDGSSWTQVYP